MTFLYVHHQVKDAGKPVFQLIQNALKSIDPQNKILPVENAKQVGECLKDSSIDIAFVYHSVPNIQEVFEQLSRNNIEILVIYNNHSSIYEHRKNFLLASHYSNEMNRDLVAVITDRLRLYLDNNEKTILHLLSLPNNYANLRFDKECAAIDTAHQSVFAKNYKIVREFCFDYTNFVEYIKKYKPSILLLSLHGSKVDGLYFRDKNGEVFPVSWLQLQEDIKKYNGETERKIELVFINACNSFEHAKNITNYVNYSIGIENTIADDDAIELVRLFYTDFFVQDNILQAFTNAKAALVAEDPRYQDRILLYLPIINPSQNPTVH